MAKPRSFDAANRLVGSLNFQSIIHSFIHSIFVIGAVMSSNNSNPGVMDDWTIPKDADGNRLQSGRKYYVLCTDGSSFFADVFYSERDLVYRNLTSLKTFGVDSLPDAAWKIA